MQDYFLRPVLKSDFHALALSLRTADRRELAASHPHQNPEDLLKKFAENSDLCRSFVYKNSVVAMGGVCHQCVWMLTGKQVEKCPKAFVKTIRNFLQKMLQQNSFLYNWVDIRYLAAQKLIVRLGGIFSGDFVVIKNTKFLFFYFRRSFDMGGIIQTGQTYVSTASQAFKKRKHQVEAYTENLAQTQQEKQQLFSENAQQNSYLFRSAAEKQRALYQQLNEALARRQSKLAKNGVTAVSPTAELVQNQAVLQAQLQSEKQALRVQQELAHNDQQTAQRAEVLTRKEQAYRKGRNIKSALWKIGKQLLPSWLK